MSAFSLFPADPGGLRLPFRRRRSRIERLRRQAARQGRRAAATARKAVEELPVEAPDLGRATEAARRALADRQLPPLPFEPPDLARAAAAARQALADRRLAVEPPEFLRERLRVDRIAAVQRRPTGLARLWTPQVRPWVIAAAALAGAAIGLGAGMWYTGRRARAQAGARRMQSATDEIKAAWPQVTEADIEQARGSADRLAEVIRERTGQDAESVRTRLAGMTGTDE